MLAMLLLGCVALIVGTMVFAKILNMRAERRFPSVKKPGTYMKTSGLFEMIYRILPASIRGSLMKPEYFMKMGEMYGEGRGIYHTFFGPYDQLMVTEANVAKEILLNIKKFPKLFLGTEVSSSPSYRFLGRNVVFINGEEWKHNRHFVDPAFYSIDFFFPSFASVIDECLDIWETRNAPLYVRDEMTKMTVDVLGKSVMGVDFQARNNKLNEYLQSYLYLWERVLVPIRMILPITNKLPTQENRNINEHLIRFDKKISELMDLSKMRIQQREKGEYDGEKNLLEMLIEGGNKEEKGLTIKQIRDNLVVFFVAGHETTATALEFGLFRLAQHQDVQTKMYEEIIAKVPGTPTFEQVNDLEYVDAFINEVMRLHAPVPWIPPRIASEDTELAGFKIPKGTTLTIQIHAIQLSDTVYKNAKTFRPERWIGEEKAEIPRFGNISMGAGARVCLGKNFSLVEQRLFYAQLLKRFRVELTPGYKYTRNPTNEFIPHLTDDFAIILKKRE
jgi:cytochrome P450